MVRAENWIDVHDDEMMVREGVRVPPLVMILNTCPKTDYERRILRTCRRQTRQDYHFHTDPGKHNGTYGDLIIQLKSNKVFGKSTYHIKCWNYEIPEILSKYTVPKRKGKEEYLESVIVKCSWNGKEIKA